MFDLVKKIAVVVTANGLVIRGKFFVCMNSSNLLGISYGCA